MRDRQLLAQERKSYIRHLAPYRNKMNPIGQSRLLWYPQVVFFVVLTDQIENRTGIVFLETAKINLSKLLIVEEVNAGAVFH